VDAQTPRTDIRARQLSNLKALMNNLYNLKSIVL
jgi:hypothetical protein